MVRFELTIELPRCQFSKLVPSTTQPHLLMFTPRDCIIFPLIFMLICARLVIQEDRTPVRPCTREVPSAFPERGVPS